MAAFGHYDELVEHRFTPQEGLELAYYETGMKGDPVLLLCHATGFHAQVWRQTISHLPAGFHIIALDMRGHGMSDELGYMSNWRDPADDVIALIDLLNLNDIVGVGHSFGGMVTATAATIVPEKFKRLVLIDPVILPPEVYGNDPVANFGSPALHPMAKRREHWDSAQQMFDRFKDRHPYNLWVPQALMDYCEHGLVPNPKGDGYILACNPVFEASIYMTSASFKVHGDLHKITCPVKILRAKERTELNPTKIDFSLSPTWPNLVNEIPNATDVHLDFLTHFMPMEHPEAVAQLVADPDYVAEDLILNASTNNHKECMG